MVVPRENLGLPHFSKLDGTCPRVLPAEHFHATNRQEELTYIKVVGLIEGSFCRSR
jgi:hypothetical protein